MHTVNSVVDLLAIDTCCIPDADGVRTASYHPPQFPATEFFGGREYVWTDGLPRSEHDGGTYISPTVPWDGTLATHPDFLAGAGETDPTADGCWVLRRPDDIHVEDYGAIGNWDEGTSTGHDDYDAINAALSRHLRFINGTHIVAGKVRLRSTSYYLRTHLNIKTEVHLEGVKGSSLLRFPQDSAGIIIHRDDTIDYTTVDPPTGDSRGTTLVGFGLMGDYGSNTDGHGIHMRHKSVIEYVTCEKFSGNGINIEATATSGDPARVGNANGWFLSHIYCGKNKGHGVYVDGADVNAGYGYKVDCTSNEGWGIYDSSFLGNTWGGCHTANNDFGGYNSDNPNARTLLVGCYGEGNQPPSVLESPAMAIGGIHGNGIHGAYMDGDDLTIRNVNATQYVKSSDDDLDYTEHFIAHNTSGRGVDGLEPHARYEAGYAGYSAWKADGSPRPSGAITFRPQGTDRDEQTVIEFYVFDGDGSDEIVKVAHFWGTKDFTPENDNTTQMGWSGGAWRTLYLNHGVLTPCQSDMHSDKAALDTAELAVASALKGLVRKFKRTADSDNVLHVGIEAEDVEAAFAAESLDAYDYGVLEGGERKHVRYEELLAFIIAAL